MQRSKMKTFKSYLKEQGMGVGPSHSGSAMDADVNIAALGDPAVVKRLNAMVGQIGNMEYLIPEFLQWKAKVVHLIYH
jgi:hypothetical protein